MPVIIYTKAYNAEKTLRRAIDSVLRQTYTDFIYHILDNASTDKTGDIIKEYAGRDSRIVATRSDVNDFYLSSEEVTMLSNIYPDGFFAMLDADDEYKPDFIEKMLRFMLENRLEVAVCGTDLIDAKTNTLIRHKSPPQNIILEERAFADCFPAYRNYTTAIWGILYSFSVLKKCDFSKCRSLLTLSDSAFTMEVFRNANRAGVLAESLHRYYSAQNTASYAYEPSLFFGPCKSLLRITREYLLHYGEISKSNEDYLQVLFFILLKYALSRLQNTNASLADKLDAMREIFSDEDTRTLLRRWGEVGIYSDKAEFLREVQNWIYAQPDWKVLRASIESVIDLLNHEEKIL